MPTTVEKIAFSRGQDHGSYANAYSNDDVEGANLDAQARAYADDNGLGPGAVEAYAAGALLGFFDTYEIHEIPADYQTEVGNLRATEGSWALTDTDEV